MSIRQWGTGAKDLLLNCRRARGRRGALRAGPGRTGDKPQKIMAKY